jgi:chromosome segregation ATPase
MQELDGALNDAYREHQGLTVVWSQFVLDVSIAVNDNPLRVESLYDANALEQVGHAVAELRKTADNLRYERDALQATANHFADAFGCNDADQISVIDRLKKFQVEIAGKLAKKSKALKAARRELSRLAAAVAQADATSASREGELSEWVDRLTSQLQSAAAASNGLKSENQRLSRELDDTADSLRLAESQRQDAHFQVTQKAAAELAIKFEKLQEEHSQLQEAHDQAKADRAKLR